MANKKCIDIDFDGDVVFICTADDGHSVHIRVLSVFVSNASPVLKAMLGPILKEEKSEIAKLFGVEVPLPSDDPVAMTYILRAMHMRNETHSGILEIPPLKQIAIAVDKYKCAEPLVSITSRWVQGRVLDKSRKSCGVPELYELLHVTYLLGQQEWFGHVGILLVLRASGPIRGIYDDIARAYDVLEMQRLHTSMSITMYVQEAISKAYDRYKNCSGQGCTYGVEYGAKFLDVVRKHWLWSLNFDTHHIDGVLRIMDKIDFKDVDSIQTKHEQGCKGPPFADQSNESALKQTSADFRWHVSQVKKDVKPLCLQCIKTGCVMRNNCFHIDSFCAFSSI